MSKIDSTPPIVYYTGTGTVTRYPFDFMFWENKDIKVYVDDVLQTAGYSVESANPEEGGTVVFAAAPANNSGIAIACETEAKRTSEFEESGVFRAKVMNDELNHIIGSIQQLGQKVSKCVSWPISFSGGDLVLPKADPGKTLLWNADGTGLQNSKDNFDNLYSNTKNQADLATAKASVATEQAGIATAKAAAAAASAASAAETVEGFDSHAAGLQAQYDDNAAAKTAAFDSNASGKTSDYDANAAQKVSEYNTNHTAKLKVYNDNHDAKLAAYNANAAQKQAAVDASATAAAESATAAETALNTAVGTIDTAKDAAIGEFDSNAAAKTSAFDANAAAKTTAFDSNAAEKQTAVDTSATAAAQSAAEAKQYRDEAQEIANMPLATEDLVGGAMLATEAEALAGTDDSKIITAKKLKVVADTKAAAADLTAHTGNQDNPHGVTKAQIGLGNVDNTADADKPASTAVQAALDTKAAAADLTAHTGNTANPHAVTKAQVGLGNVDNTSDANKPVSTAVQNALNAKAPLASPGFTGTPTVPTAAVGDNSTKAANTAYVNNFQSAVTALTATSGTVALAVNKIYTLSISGATTFSLPTPSNTNIFNQIKVMLKVTGTPTVNWGTTQFFNKATPEIAAGNYDVYFDYDKNMGAWVAGAMPKGAAS